MKTLAPFVLFRENRIDQRFELSAADAVAQFKASEQFQAWQDGWPLARAVGVFVAFTLNAVPDSPHDLDRLRSAILAES